MDLKRIAADEPARVRAAWTAIVAVLAGVGVTVSQDVDGWVQAAVLGAAAVLPILQGEATRAKVTPVAKLQTTHAGRQPGDWAASIPVPADRAGDTPPETLIED